MFCSCYDLCTVVYIQVVQLLVCSEHKILNKCISDLHVLLTHSKLRKRQSVENGKLLKLKKSPPIKCTLKQGSSK